MDYLFNCLNLTNDNNLKEEIKNLFSFFQNLHIGYILTFFTSSNALDVIFGDDFGPYLLSTENFNGLKYDSNDNKIICKDLFTFHKKYARKIIETKYF